VASEIDFDSTLVGGTEQLIGAILAEPGLDAWAVDPDDSLAYDADKINHVPPWKPPPRSGAQTPAKSGVSLEKVARASHAKPPFPRRPRRRRDFLQ
jgi:hypothetical protein